MPDPRLVSRAQRAATLLERAWERWRTTQGLEAEPLPPVSSYVGYSIEEPWGRPRVVFGVDAEDAERLAALLQTSIGFAAETGTPGSADPGSRAPGRPGFAADRPAGPDRGYDQSLLDDVRGRIPVQGWPAEFSESRGQLNGAGPAQPGLTQPGEPELPLDLGSAGGGLVPDAEHPGRPDDLTPLSELGLSDEFRSADDFAGPDEPRPFGVDTPHGADAPYGVPYTGGAPYGVPYPGEPYDPAGPYGASGGYAPADGYAAPGGPGAGDGDRPAGELRAAAAPGQDVRDDQAGTSDVPGQDTLGQDAPAGDEPAGDAPAGEVRNGDEPAGEVRDGDAPAGEVRDGDEPAAEGIRGDQQPGTTGQDDGPVPGLRHGSGSAGPDRRPPAPGDSPSSRDDSAASAPGDPLASAPDDSPSSSPGAEPPAATHSDDQAPEGPAAASDPSGDPASRGSITDTMAAELAGWAAGELPGQAAARLASWATAGGAVARSRQQARLGTGGTATERVS
jgi:hypothetical protein